MPDKIYANQLAMDTINSMMENNRLAHSFLIFGDNGLGKKSIAEYFAMKMLCENKTDTPFGKCRACRNIRNHVHPDVIWVEHSGKLQGFSAETIRNICSEAFVTPATAERKIYIFADADQITVQAQNSLLKLIEEPPDFTYFIFTAKDKNSFLATIISRVIAIGVSECSEEECRTALAEKGFAQDDINDAVNCFPGNIGMCIDYLQNEKMQTCVKLTRRAVSAIINRNEYELLKTFSAFENDRDMAKFSLSLLDKQFRDASTVRFVRNFTGCCHEEALKMSDKLTVKSCNKLHSLISDAFMRIESNVSLKLVLSALCGEIMGVS